ARTPDAIALVFGDKRLSYKALDDEASRIAVLLANRGIGPESLVGLCMERTPRMIAALMAVLKAGAGYVPLDPSYPRHRLELMTEDAGLALVLTEGVVSEVLPEANLSKLLLDATWTEAQANVAPRAPRPDNVAYVIYTSGSTGLPKGVAITHRSAVELIRWSLGEFTPTDLAGVLFSTSVCFDTSIFELFVTLSVGGTLIIARDALETPSLP